MSKVLSKGLFSKTLEGGHLEWLLRYQKGLGSNFDPVKQAEFKEWYEDFEKNITDKETIVFADAVYPQHNTKICNVWVEKGKDKEIKTNSGRTRININGAYNPHTTDIIARQDDTINSKSAIKLFQDIEKFYPEKAIIYFIADNAQYNKSKVVFEY